MAFSQILRRIGVVDQTSAGWTASAGYTTMLAYSLVDACQTADVELYLFAQHQNSYLSNGLPANVIPLASHEYLPGERRLRRWLGVPDKSHPFRGELRLRRWLGLPDKTNVFSAARRQEISVLLPLSLSHVPAWDTAVKTIGWIPDFQHIFLPEFFSESDCQQRDNGFRHLAERATLIMLSSRSVLDHFTAFVPEHAHKARVVPFPSLFAFKPPTGDAHSSQSRFHLPAKFALVANQFWRHKNHLVVVEAIGQLTRKGIRIPVVMTGLPADYRDLSNQTVSRLLQTIASAGLFTQVIVLGQVEYADLANLMRTAAVIIQPSRFEGWSTVVQDSKALGRPLLCSDLPVHREQAPEALGFFPCDRPDILADLLAAHWDGLEPGPDPAREARALLAEREFARLHGQSLLKICQEACSA